MNISTQTNALNVYIWYRQTYWRRRLISFLERMPQRYYAAMVSLADYHLIMSFKRGSMPWRTVSCKAIWSWTWTLKEIDMRFDRIDFVTRCLNVQVLFSRVREKQCPSRLVKRRYSLFQTSALDGSKWSLSHYGHFTSGKVPGVHWIGCRVDLRDGMDPSVMRKASWLCWE
jgi:hypothetical protein